MTPQEDLLERAAIVGRELRETAEGLEVLKHEVLQLRESIRSVGSRSRSSVVVFFFFRPLL